MYYLAHISKDKKREQSILEHLENTGRKAKEFAKSFRCECESVALFCGNWHDIGKYSEEFQRHIRGEMNRVDHATAGAQEVYRLREKYGMIAVCAAYCIAGHHAGLPNGGSTADTSDNSSLCGRMGKKIPDYTAFCQEVLLSELKPPKIKIENHPGMSLSFFIRMIYSCLVDADFLDTEEFMIEGETQRGKYDSITILLERIQKYTNSWLKNTDRMTINGRRSEILRNCYLYGEKEQGLFSLTVPTGGGKTISSLAFALKHAEVHHLERIIYVIPYTSIIEQNAEVFRTILGERNVLEAHCNVEYDGELELNEKQLAAENWDMPIIVTTNVQFFESLFSNKSSKCRKLHNISNSVIIFDEAQMLPIEYLKPCIFVMEELIKNYHSTVVLCTATQPSLKQFFSQNYSMREICPALKEQYEFFKRTELHNLGSIQIEELISKMESQDQILCILNNKKRVQQIYEKLKEEGVYHLSTFMYPKHRKEVLEIIRKRLREGKKCKLIATSLVEAGVDLDFRQVYRELAGVDSIIQAAGRCNREGKYSAKESGTYIFTFSQENGMGILPELRRSFDVAKQVLQKYEDISDLEAIQYYFDSLYHLEGDGLDKKEILKSLDEMADQALFPFADIAKQFKLIKEQTKRIIIDREDEGKELIKRLRYGERSRRLIRKIGQFCVEVSSEDYEILHAAGMLEILDEEMVILRAVDLYSEEMGLKMDVHRGDALIM